MNILQLCKAAERYELLCMMNLSDDEIAKASATMKIPFGVLKEFITMGYESNDRGSRFASLVFRDEELATQILLNDSFYDVWEEAVNK